MAVLRRTVASGLVSVGPSAWLRAGMIGLVAVGLAALMGGCGGPPEEPPQFAAQWDSGGARVGTVNYPEGICIGRKGELLVADTWNDRIVRADPEGKVATAFGEFGTGPGQFECPRAVTTDRRGSIYVVDHWNHRIQKFSPEGRFLLEFAEQGGPWGEDEAYGKFSYPYGVAVDSAGYIYVSDFNNNRIQKFDPRGKIVTDEDGEPVVWGTAGRQDGQFNNPAGMAIDSRDRLYVADVGNNRIQRFTTEGDFDGKWGKEGRKRGEFDRPYGVCVDEDDNVYVADTWNHRVQKFTPTGRLLWVYEGRGEGEGELELPLSVAVGEDGSVYVADWGNNRIQKLTPAS